MDALQNYLQQYTTALKNTPFKFVYTDAFAGAGVHFPPEKLPSLFDEVASEEGDKYRHGSPLIALPNTPPFHEFVFIEQDAASIARLKTQVDAHLASSGRAVRFLQGDANEELMKLTREDWRSRRGVAFLDPFALQVRWDTIEQIGRTQAIDMWLLFPAMAVNRMLPKTEKFLPNGRKSWNSFSETPTGEIHFIAKVVRQIYSVTKDLIKFPEFLKRSADMSRNGCSLFSQQRTNIQ